MSDIQYCNECGGSSGITGTCTCHCPECHELWERCSCPPDFDDGDIEDIVDEGLDGWEN